MTLTGITISGADDDVDPNDLAGLSHDFPFVEWGVLISKRPGRPRYPTMSWLWSLSSSLLSATECSCTQHPPRLSAHLCGEAAREFCAGEASWIRALPTTVGRVQINGCKPWPPSASEVYNALADRGDVELIIQVQQVADLVTAALFAEEFALLWRAGPKPKISALFDPSGGRGVESVDVFPIGRLSPSLQFGYAGGIKPSTIESVVTKIGKRPEPYWLDMESGVRTDDRFDLRLVREVLERAAPHVRSAT